MYTANKYGPLLGLIRWFPSQSVGRPVSSLYSSSKNPVWELYYSPPLPLRRRRRRGLFDYQRSVTAVSLLLLLMWLCVALVMGGTRYRATARLNQPWRRRQFYDYYLQHVRFVSFVCARDEMGRRRHCRKYWNKAIALRWWWCSWPLVDNRDVTMSFKNTHAKKKKEYK